MNRKTDYLLHIKQAITDAQAYIEGLDFDAFLKDKRTQQACTMNLLIIGEAATKLINAHPDFIQNQPEIAWHSMRGMRNRLAHAYFDIDLAVVWQTLQAVLPDLLNKINAILENEP